MSSPTAKEISKAFPKLGEAKAKELAEALAHPFKVDEESEGRFDDDFLKAVDDAMDAANDVLDGYGVEAVQGEGADLGRYWRDTIALYVNLGDTYDTTILFDTDREEFLIGSWGDFLEDWEKGSEEEEEDEEEEGEEEEDEEGDEEGVEEEEEVE